MTEDPRKDEPGAKDVTSGGQAGGKGTDPGAAGKDAPGRSPAAGSGSKAAEPTSSQGSTSPPKGPGNSGPAVKAEAGKPGGELPGDAGKPATRNAASKEPSSPEAGKEPGKASAKDSGKGTAPAAAAGAVSSTATPKPGAEAAKPGADAAKPGEPSPRKPGETAPSAGRPGGAGGKPPGAAQTKRRGGCLTALVVVIAAIVAVGVGGYFTWPHWSPYAQPYLEAVVADDEREARLAELEERMAALQQTVQQEIPDAAALAALKDEAEALRGQLDAALGRVQELEQSIVAVQEAMPVIDEDAPVIGRLDRRLGQVEAEMDQLARLRARIDQVEEKAVAAQAVTAGAAAVALALNRLDEAVSGPSPFRDDLRAVAHVVPATVRESESWAVLDAHADQGVPSVAALYRRYPAMADSVKQASRLKDDDGWAETILNRLQGLVTVRRTGEAALAAGGVDAILEVGWERMQAGDLAATVAALAELEGRAAEAAAPWIRDARARLDADRALAQLRLQAVSALATAEGEG
ncbi:MAG: hypothetical protein EA406_09800 [Rhodospirillales bacterium]|nr:MAG: hypothetical protein EA406_09800 [Rhodospirillales bacterium]